MSNENIHFNCVAILAVVFVSLVLIFTFTNAEAIPEYKTAFTGNFNGKFDGLVVDVDGKYRADNMVDTFAMIGTLTTADVNHFNPVTGKYVKSSPTCHKVDGDLVLQSKMGQIKLDFNGKKCMYGLKSYVIGTFEIVNATDSYENSSGDGRLTFVTDHHNNNVKGNLKGSIRG